MYLKQNWYSACGISTIQINLGSHDLYLHAPYLLQYMYFFLSAWKDRGGQNKEEVREEAQNTASLHTIAYWPLPV